MKKLFARLTGVLFVLLAPMLALAAPNSQFLIEPSLGYRNEAVRLVDKFDAQTNLKASMPVLGLRLGYRTPVGVDFDLAFDYSKGKLTVSGFPEKNDFNHQTASLQLGINAMDFMKIYLGYAFLNDFNVDGTDSLAGFKMSGPAYIVGLQLKLFQYLNIGAQYNLNQFKKVSGSAYPLGDDTETYYRTIDTQDYSLYLSAEF